MRNYVKPGINDLETCCKEKSRLHLLEEWDYEENIKLGYTPQNVSYGSHKEVIWKCRICGHKWSATVCDRFFKSDCPNCNSQTSFSEQAILYYLKPYFHDILNRYNGFSMELDIYIPSIKTAIEYDGRLYHKDVDIDIRKNQLCKENDIKLIRIREEGLCYLDSCICIFRENMNDKYSINGAIKKLLNFLGIHDYDVDTRRDNIPIIEQNGTAKLDNSIAVKTPEMVKWWHSTLNGKLTPENISYSSNEKFWWVCSECNEPYKVSPNGRKKGNTMCRSCYLKKKQKKVKCIETNITYNSIAEAQTLTNINSASICNVCKGKQHTAGGYHWKYVE